MVEAEAKHRVDKNKQLRASRYIVVCVPGRLGVSECEKDSLIVKETST